MRDRLQKAIDDALATPEFQPGGTILCPEGHMLIAFHGDQKDFEREKEWLSYLSSPLCACHERFHTDDVIVRWRRPPKVPTQVTVDIADLQALLHPTAKVAKTTLCCPRQVSSPAVVRVGSCVPRGSVGLS